MACTCHEVEIDILVECESIIEFFLRLAIKNNYRVAEKQVGKSIGEFDFLFIFMTAQDLTYLLTLFIIFCLCKIFQISF